MSEVQQQSPRDPVPVMMGTTYPCPYLDGRTARLAYATRLPGGEGGYTCLLDAGFRRSGSALYRTACGACQECRPLRVLVGEFKPDRSQRRALARNREMEVFVGPPRFDEERAALFAKYLERRHDGRMDSDPMVVEETLYRSPTDTLELTARLEGRIVAAAIIDLPPTLLSMVYSAWDTDLSRRSLGTSVILWTLSLARRMRLPYVHLGFWVRGSRTMAYKANFRPHEVLLPDGTWHRPVPPDSANTRSPRP